jgi:hypothetical protein
VDHESPLDTLPHTVDGIQQRLQTLEEQNDDDALNDTSNGKCERE